LLLISSSIVRDIYQRMIRPNASNKTLKYASIGVTVIVGIVVLIGAMNPPTFLQYIIVFSTSGLGCAFAFPMALTIFWKRTTRSGAIAGMLGGVLTVFALYGLGWIDGAGRMRESLGWLPGWGQPKFSAMAPYNLAGLDPLVWGLALSCGLTVGVSLLTKPDETQMRKYFPPEGG
jgi:Na+/proline symporter